MQSGSAGGSQIFGIVAMVAVLCLVAWRRMRPQPVRTRRIAISGVIIVLVVLASFVATGGTLIHDTAAVALAPVFLVAGVGIGIGLVRTMRFWNDPNTGELWMRGGPLFAIVLVVSLGLRFGARMALTGSMFGTEPGSAAIHHGFLYDLSADLLLLTVGMWGARAVLLVRRAQAAAVARTT